MDLVCKLQGEKQPITGVYISLRIKIKAAVA
jgi:hypothetical protein